MNVTPGTNCHICGGAGQGEVVDLDKPESLLGDVRNNTLNVNCNIDNKCYLFGGMTSTDTVSRNTVNVYGDGSSTNTKARVGGGGVFVSGCAEKNTVNIYKDFSCGVVVGGFVTNGTSSFNIVNVYGSITTQVDVVNISGGEVKGAGSANNNRVNISGDIQNDGYLIIYGGNVTGAGSSANGNSVNFSGELKSKKGILIVGGRGADTAGNVVSISGKIGSSGGGTVTIAGSYAAKSAVNNKVIIYETAEIPDTCALYGDRLAITFSGNSLEIFFNKSLRVGRVGKFQKYQFTLGERISSECAILSFADSGEMSRRAT
ncbi:MAG: hypothetical protein LBD61_02050, partial [Endomicrobium sp.]|nr:hypothetical protein [Endomicrobium sp.]